MCMIFTASKFDANAVSTSILIKFLKSLRYTFLKQTKKHVVRMYDVRNIHSDTHTQKKMHPAKILSH